MIQQLHFQHIENPDLFESQDGRRRRRRVWDWIGKCRDQAAAAVLQLWNIFTHAAAAAAVCLSWGTTGGIGTISSFASGIGMSGARLGNN